MITTERLAEIEAAPREASIFKAEAKELADAYERAAKVCHDRLTVAGCIGAIRALAKEAT